MVSFITSGQSIEKKDLEEYEILLKNNLPKDYSAHMLKYNGGEPESTEVYYKSEEKGINLFGFYPLKYGEETLESINNLHNDFLPENHLSIGYIRGGNIAMSLGSENRGTIFIYFSTGELEFISDTFTSFVDNLVDLDNE